MGVFMKLLNKSILFGLSFILAACNSSGGNSSQKDNAVVINPVQDEQQDGINSSTENNTSHNKSSKEDKQEPSFKPSKAEGDVFTFVGMDGDFQRRQNNTVLSFDKTANPVSDIGYYGYFTMPEILDGNYKYYFYEVDQKYVLENPAQAVNAIYKGLAKMTIDGQEKDGSLTLELKDQTVSGNIKVQANNIKLIELENTVLTDKGYKGNATAAEYKGEYEGVFAGKEDKAENTLGVFYLKNKEGESVISGAYQATKKQ